MTTETPSGNGPRFREAERILRDHGGILRTSEALKAGIHPDTLYSMRDSGTLEMVSRGVYRLASGPPLSNPDFVTVATRIPTGVICLISALSYHGLTTQIPHEVHLALPRGTEEPRLDHPPVVTYRFSGKAFSEGIDQHRVDGVPVQIYNREKTLADCFKFRTRVGIDTVVEALRMYLQTHNRNLDDVMTYAAICRVQSIMRPYLETLL